MMIMGGGIMGWWWLMSCLCLLILPYCSSSFSSNSSLPQLCSLQESSALLNFKNSFSIDSYASIQCDEPYPKTDSWKENTDCCTWDGVACDVRTGHVIGIDLTCSMIFGTLHSNNTLFRLPHIRRLNLASNDFNHSQIPSDFGASLTGLTHLNLSDSMFSGQIPAQLSHLSKLVSLDLSLLSSCELGKQNFKRLVQNLTELKELVLDVIDMSSVELGSLRNLSSSLISLSLSGCELQGRLPHKIFRLPNLQNLYLNDNNNLTGDFPKGNWSSPLRILHLSFTSFSGKLHNSIGNLKSLSALSLAQCYFYGPLPASLGNLTQITYLRLSVNQFSGEIPSSIVNLVQLENLDLSRNNLSGQLPSSIVNLTQLQFLDLSNNQFVGSIPSGVLWPSNLTWLILNNNQLSGMIPSWLYRLQSMEILDFSNNQLTGHIEDFLSRILRKINLSNNKLQGQIPRSIFEQVNLDDLNLSYNNFSGSMDVYVLPELKKIQQIDLSNNQIGGLIPKWLLDSGKETLHSLNLSHNVLEGFNSSSEILSQSSIVSLDLQSNRLHGSLPIPSPVTLFYMVANNMLSGVLTPLICQSNSLSLLDLSNNDFDGLLPPCLGNFSSSLTVLNLHKNRFHGPIPQTFSQGSMLRSLDVSDNKLQGLVPRSLVHCTELEVLNLGKNDILDTFPFWLEILPKFQVLILRSNRFHGPILQPKRVSSFSNLNIIDLSYNNFTGVMPSKFFMTLRSMATVNDSGSQTKYMGDKNIYYFDSVTVVSKGLELKLVRILTIFRAIDFSNNNFEGEIPNSIGNLKSIRVLNVSGNSLGGHIPSSLGNLSVIESLDLSRNNLSGEIPKELTSLTSLSVFDVSQNNLEGPIPYGSQFNTFSNNSYEGNSGLCGFPLTKKCGSGEKAPSPPSKAKESQSSSMFTMDFYMWIVVLMGYGCGLVIGVVGGNYIMQKKEQWLMKTFGIGQHRQGRRLNWTRRNGTRRR